MAQLARRIGVSNRAAAPRAGWLSLMREGFRRWLVEHEYTGIDQLRGSMNLGRCPDPAGFERAQYLHVVQSW